MHILGILLLAVQVYFAVHAIRTGRDRWIFLIILVPAIGCLIYFFSEYLPDVRRSPKTKKLGADIMKSIDPTRDMRKLKEQVEISGSVRNKHDLAVEMIDNGLYTEAAEILEGCLDGLFKNDPHILVDLAFAYFMLERYQDTLTALDDIKDANPNFESQKGHLLYARSQEKLGRNEEALDTYESLVNYANGAEAKCRYAILLNKTGYTEKAGEIFSAIVQRAKHSPEHYKKAQKEWITIARQNLS